MSDKEKKNEKIIEKLLELIKEGQDLATSLYRDEDLDLLSDGRKSHNVSLYPRAIKWASDSSNLLKLRFGSDSHYLSDFVREIGKKLEARGGRFYRENVANGTAVLEHIQGALVDGLTDDLFYKREIQVFGDLLDQAFEFLENGHEIAAVIYGRIVLETTVREFARKEGVEEKKFDQVIIKLRQKEIIQKPVESSLRANYQLGSLAAHGDKKFEDYSKSGIREYLNFIRDKVLTL